MGTSDKAWLPEVRLQLEALAQKPVGTEGTAQLMKALKQLDVILARYRAEMPNDLVHYLERRSYEKASKFCETLAFDSTHRHNVKH